MKTKVFFFTLLFCSILMISCQKEDTSYEILYNTQNNVEALINHSKPNDPIHQNNEGKKAPVCTKIFLSTDVMTVSSEQYELILNTLFNVGIGFQGPNCSVYYLQNVNVLSGWAQKVNDALDVISIDDDNDTITFRINNLPHVCYKCFFNPFCNLNNTNVQVILGNWCIIGEFNLDINSNQYVHIDLSSIINGTCTALC